MANILLQYMVERFNMPASNEPRIAESLPFITISREYGCPARDVASILEKKLNADKISDTQNWKVISREIMEKAAKELHVDLSRIRKIFDEEKRNTIDEILEAFSEKYYISDRKVVHTLSTIIRDFAIRGNVIIIGRNGVGITAGLPNGMHIRLIAPIEWRVKQLMEKTCYKTLEEARSHAEEIDYRRKLFLHTKSQKDPVFDIYYNSQRFSAEEIADSIIFHLTMRKQKSNKSFSKDLSYRSALL